MRVAIVSHTYVVRANRGKLEALARIPGVQVLVIAPKTWRNRDIGQRFALHPQEPGPLSMSSVRAWSLGSGSLITYAPLALWRLLRGFRPDLIHFEEEPWSAAALELTSMGNRFGVPVTFFTWENIDRPLLPPFRLILRRTLRLCSAAIAGNHAAKALLERRGFAGPVMVLPQLGVDLSSHHASSAPQAGPVIGYVGRLVPQKGLLVLLRAMAMLPASVRLMVVGQGPLRKRLLATAREFDLDGRVELHEGVAHEDVPAYLARMSVLVLPSLTTPTWKEQFGHVLIEAMACGVPIVGSNSGAIPEVIGDAGIVVPEGDERALSQALHRLGSESGLRAELAARGRSRVLAEYTNEVVAQHLAGFWAGLLKERQ